MKLPPSSVSFVRVMVLPSAVTSPAPSFCSVLANAPYAWYEVPLCTSAVFPVSFTVMAAFSDEMMSA